MKTSYPEFYHYLMENTDNCCDLMQQLKSDINADKELWSDMEVAFGLQKTVDIPVLGGWISTVFCMFCDSNNDVIGFTRDHTQHLPSHPGCCGTPGIPALEWKPGKPGFEGEPGRPGYGGWSSMDFEDYIKEC